MPTYVTPGVIIEEEAAVGPIAGVGTSTCAFLGPTVMGPTSEPKKITNWSEFTAAFGGYSGTPRLYLPHAVDGFFTNGGQVAYVVRVGTAVKAFVDLPDGGTPPGTALRVQALREGSAGNNIQVAVTSDPIVQHAKVHKARAAITAAQGLTVTLTNAGDAAQFAPGDWITIEGSTERAQIDHLLAGTVFLTTNLTGTFGSSAFLRIADLAVGQRAFRIDGTPASSGAAPSPVTGVEAGSVLHLETTTIRENVVVDAARDGSQADRVVRVGGTGLQHSYPLGQNDPDLAVTTIEFGLVVNPASTPPSETWGHLSVDPRHSRYAPTTIKSQFVSVAPPPTPSVQVPPGNQPAVTTTPIPQLANGADDDPKQVDRAYLAAVTALEAVDDVELVCAPGATDTPVQQLIIAHCEKMADRFAILDPIAAAPPFGSGSVLNQRTQLVSERGYSALYYPWLVAIDPTGVTGTEKVTVPPSGHIAGIFARSDAQYGVQKAPANELVNGAVDVERRLTDADQGQINLQGVNAIRVFADQGRPIVWGARTTAPPDQTDWLYANVRRVLLFVENSIRLGIRWAVFEPITPGLYQTLKRDISEFLTRVWTSGALFGTTASEAFYVSVSAELNPPAVRALGQVVVEIGIAPVRPAEFIVVRLSIWDGGSLATGT